MDSSPVLRQQSQNKIRSDFMRMKNENNKMPAHPKSSKPLCAPHPSKQDIENKDPGNVGMGGKAPVRPGVSRLPVLAKSLHLQTPSDFSHSHCTWEEKPLAGKSKKKKACTRPVPFNLSQPKSSRNATENQQPLIVSQSRTGIHTLQPDTNVCNARLKTQNINAKPTKHPAMLNSNVDSTKGTGKSNGKATDKTSQLSQHSGPLSHPLSSIPNKTVHQSSATLSAQAAVNAEACLDNMNLLSLKDLTKTSHKSQSVSVTAQDSLFKGSADKGENFQSNHEALLSILRNEGVSAKGPTSATPQSKPYNYLPQRMSVMKSRQKAAPPTGSMKSVQFSPDSAALQSILQNEGVKVGGLLGATQRNSVRASGRGTSIYSAQRVPVRKNREEVTGGPGAGALKEFQPNKCTPQRVQNTRHQPMSAMKWHLSTQQSPCADSPRLQSGKTNSQQQEEEVVQKLFDDQEDEKSANVTEKGSVKSVQFSPDSAALQSILQNEGVKVGGFLGAAHRNSVCPSGRGTSIYSAQRVPVRKSRADVAGGPGARTPKETPLNKCTPQRVRNTRHQPVSAMKWHLSTQKSLYTGTPGQQSCQTNTQQHQEEVVQKLFDDQENEQGTNVTDKNPETQAEQLPVQATTKSSCEETVERSRASSSEDEEHRIVAGRPFIQAPQRESVIFFSTGKKLLRAPRFEQQEKSAHDEQHGLVSSEQRNAERLQIHEETSSVSEPTCQINPSVQSLHRDLIVQKTCALGPAVAMLRKRFPALEELRMDEEVATYTSVSVPVTPGFLPPRPRCGNPLATILHFEESTRFIPIVCDLSSGPCSPQISPLHER